MDMMVSMEYLFVIGLLLWMENVGKLNIYRHNLFSNNSKCIMMTTEYGIGCVMEFGVSGRMWSNVMSSRHS